MPTRSNPKQSNSLGPALVVGNTAATAAATVPFSARWGDQWDFVIRALTLGAVTDLRMRVYTSGEIAPAPFTAGGNVDWVPLTSMALAAGVATMSIFEASFPKATFFPVAGNSMGLTLPARSRWLVVELYDGAGNGAGSSFSVEVYTRRGGM